LHRAAVTSSQLKLQAKWLMRMPAICLQLTAGNRSDTAFQNGLKLEFKEVSLRPPLMSGPGYLKLEFKGLMTS
jgi:hypothetical protein